MIEIDPTRVRVATAEEVRLHATPQLAYESACDAARLRLRPDTEIGRLNLPLPGGWMRVLAAALPGLGVFGYKEFHFAPGGVLRYAIHLFSTEDGRPLGVVDASLVTTLRTAASATAAAAAYFRGRQDPLSVGMIGSGAEARAGLRALASALPVQAAYVSSRNEQNRRAFGDEMSAELDIPVLPATCPEAATADADVVYLATGSKQVVIQPEALAGVRLVLSIGSTMPDQRELPGVVLADASRLVLDTPDVLEESGDAIEAVDEGLDATRSILLGEFIDSADPAVPGTTLYKSIGSPEQDVVLAKAIIDRLAQDGAPGRVIESLTGIKRNL